MNERSLHFQKYNTLKYYFKIIRYNFIEIVLNREKSVKVYYKSACACKSITLHEQPHKKEGIHIEAICASAKLNKFIRTS